MNPFKTWTKEEIILELKDSPEQLALYKKFLEVGYDGLEGKNVIITDKPATEYYKLCCLLQKFNRMIPTLYFFTESQWNDIKENINLPKT